MSVRLSPELQLAGQQIDIDAAFAGIAANIGIVFDTSERFAQRNPNYSLSSYGVLLDLSAADETGVLNINAREVPSISTLPDWELSVISPDPTFTWNGLLTSQHGTTQVPSGNAAKKTHLYNVNVMSSPSAINNTLRLLGRQPGNDVFMLDRIPGSANQTAGDWVTSISNGRISIADLVNSTYWMHDLRVKDHLPTWFTMHQQTFGNLVDHAQQLQDEYGDQIHLTPAEGRPPVIGKFVDGIDKLNYVGQTVLLNTHMSAGFDTIDAAIGALESSVLNYWIDDRSLSIVQQSPDGRGMPELWPLIHSGLLPATGPVSEARKRLSQIRAQFITTAASMLINAEEIKPSEVLSTDDRMQKLNTLNLIKKSFAERAA